MSPQRRIRVNSGLRQMTLPLTATDQETLWVTDAELIRRMGVPEKIARETLRVLDDKRDFPAKQKLWGNRRYWPAVLAYFNKRYGGMMDANQAGERRYEAAR